MKKLNVFIAAVLVLGLLGFAGFAETDPIKVGVISPHSPPGSLDQGSEGRIGLKIAKEMINERGGILGRKVELVFLDSRGVPQEGRSAVQRLITKENVDLLTGGIHSSVCMTVSDLVHNQGRVFMNVNCWSDKVREKGYNEWWNTSVNNSRMALAGANAVNSLGAKRVVAFAENTDFGIGLAKKLKRQLEEKYPNIDYEYKVLNRKGKDFTSAITPLMKNPPDVVVPIMDPPGGYILINQLKEKGVAPTFDTWLVDLDGLAALPGFWDNVGDAGKNMIGLVLFHPNINLTPVGEEVKERYVEREGSGPSRLVFQGFDALWTLADAAMRAGSTETDPLINALEKTKLVGSRGVITFNMEQGPFYQQWVEVPYAMVQFKEVGQPVDQAPIVLPEKQATAEPTKPE